MSALRRIVAWLPRDMSLPEEEFRSRHRAMTVMLLLHVPALFAYGYVVRGVPAVPLGMEVAFPLVAAVLGALPSVRKRIRMFAVTTGLIYSSVALLHLSGGAAESALHFLIVLAFVFLYREWFLFLWAILLMGSSHQLLEVTQGVLGDGTVGRATPEMALWALMTAASIASVGLILAWKSAEDSHRATLAALETANERDEAAARRDAYGRMYVNLARRSQSLVDRQLKVIDRLEGEVDDPDILAAVFELDHLTTRVRRHGESLLVVADVDLPTRSDEPVSLSDVVRGAQSEIEQYRRVDADVDPSIVIHGPVARDLVHLIAELLDNATTFSPPSTMVRVHARAGDAGAVVLTVEDRGLGMEPDRLARANRDLRDVDALDEHAIRQLGFRVVARLAHKHEMTVRLTSTNGGGVTAWVELPAHLIMAIEPTNLTPVRVPEPPAEPQGPVEVDAEPEPEVEDEGHDAAASLPSPARVADVVWLDVPGGEDTAATEEPPPLPRRGGESVQPTRPAASAPPAPSGPPAATAPPPPIGAEGPTVRPLPSPSAGFSANGTRRRSRRGRPPVRASHERAAPPPPVDAPAAVPADAGRPDRGAARDDTGQLPAPDVSPVTSARPAAASPPLPRRQRGGPVHGDAEPAPVDEEVMDLFGDIEDGGGGASLADYQRGQETARREARG